MRMPCSFATAVETKGSCATTSIPKARARRATSIPTLPRPTMPTVLPLSSVPCSDFFSHFPACISSLARPIWRAMASIKANVVDADARASDYPQLARMFQKLGVDLHRGADDQRVCRFQLRRQLAVELIRCDY